MDSSHHELHLYFHQQNLSGDHRCNRPQGSKVLQKLHAKRIVDDSCRVQAKNWRGHVLLLRKELQ